MAVKIMIALNTAWNLVNFRANLIRAFVSHGYEVVAVSPPDDYAKHLPKLGCRYVPISMDNKGTNPARDVLLFFRFLRLLRREKPDVFLGYTIKPNVYGSLAAHCSAVPVVNNIAGLGAVFIRKNWLTFIARGMYRVALSRSVKVFFQNCDDRNTFVQGGLVRQLMTDHIPGSGVDLKWFSQQSMPYLTPVHDLCEKKKFRFLLVARMLWDKGVGEYVEAARILKKRHTYVEFCLLGFLDVENPSAIIRAQMAEWVAEGVVNYLGVSHDVRQHLSDADCVVLPSYREGLPRTLLEAAAMARPIVTTDAVGCRDVVEHGVNGFLCRPRDVLDLTEKLDQMVALPLEARLEMGRQGRLKIEREFDEEIVIEKYLEIITTITSRQ